jgi:hypothetical protein
MERPEKSKSFIKESRQVVKIWDDFEDLVSTQKLAICTQKMGKHTQKNLD